MDKNLSYPIENGVVEVNAVTGAPIAIASTLSPGIAFLLPCGEARSPAPFEWGRGFLATREKAGFKWGHPTRLVHGPGSVTARHALGAEVELTVTRRFGHRWTESYAWRNISRRKMDVSVLGIRTPFNDVYVSAEASLRACCHAHVFPGGDHAWLWAAPMNGDPAGLGLRVTRGQVWSYSIEGREHFSSSNFRGHIVLHPTDASRAPGAFGGQPVISIEPGETYELEWEIGLHSSFAAFAALLDAPASPARLNAGLHESIELRIAEGTRTHGPTLRISPDDRSGTVVLSASTAGEHCLSLSRNGRETRCIFQFHEPVRAVVEKRVAFILKNQRAPERETGRAGAFLPYDAQTGLTIDGGAWHDWSDARERLAMPCLLQQARLRGWGDGAEIDPALQAFSNYASACLLGPEGEVWENSYDRNPKRLYNYPWLCEFFLDQHRLGGDPADLRRAALVAEAYYRLGGVQFLAFWRELPTLVEALRSAGEGARADAIAASHLAHARAFLARGDVLPAHEVNYEQSIVAPLALLYLNAHRLSGDPVFIAGLSQVLPWLEAFGGEQPHCRMRHVPIRHWDGFWFGRERLWGDVFPHYWSVLSASVFLRAAPHFPGRGERLVAKAREIYRANLINFDADGGATCAFILPSAVDGRPGHRADPSANDQDWSLVWMLRDADGLGIDLDPSDKSNLAGGGGAR